MPADCVLHCPWISAAASTHDSSGSATVCRHVAGAARSRSTSNMFGQARCAQWRDDAPVDGSRMLSQRARPSAHRRSSQRHNLRMHAVRCHHRADSSAGIQLLESCALQESYSLQPRAPSAPPPPPCFAAIRLEDVLFQWSSAGRSSRKRYRRSRRGCWALHGAHHHHHHLICPSSSSANHHFFFAAHAQPQPESAAASCILSAVSAAGSALSYRALRFPLASFVEVWRLLLNTIQSTRWRCAVPSSPAGFCRWTGLIVLGLVSSRTRKSGRGDRFFLFFRRGKSGARECDY